jgi:hypothetical protein
MRFMVQVRATRDSEAGKTPSGELVAAMGRFNEEMMNAGIMLAGEGLHPSSKGVRLVFAGGEPKLIEPPFAEPGELVSGFWIIEVDSREAAIGWAKRAPFGEGQVLEIRQVFKASDFPADILPPEEAAKEQAWRGAQQARTAPRSG